MTRKKITFIIFLLCVVISPVCRAADTDRIHGVWYFPADTTAEETLRTDLGRIAEIGFNTVLFPAVVRQEAVTSNEVSGPSAERLETTRLAIEIARDLGLKVSLTGFLLVGDGAWRGTIMPLSHKKWAQSYFDAILPYLELAEQSKVDFFCISSEMETLKGNPKIWKYLAGRSREVYSGALGYNTNWWSGLEGFATVLHKMNWLAGLDFIGVSGYFELTDSESPTREQLAAAWSADKHGQNLLAQIAGLKKKFPEQKLFLWELGYRSQDGANREPYNWGRDAPADPEEQADCFAAFLSVFPDSAIDGFGVWDLRPGLITSEKSYDFVGKPAEGIFRSFLKK